MDLRSWPKRWNDTSLRQIARLPENSPSRPWPMLGMLALGLVAGAAIGGYAVSQRSQMKRLTLYAQRFGDDTSNVGTDESVEPIAVSSSRSNHRRKAATRV